MSNAYDVGKAPTIDQFRNLAATATAAAADGNNFVRIDGGTPKLGGETTAAESSKARTAFLHVLHQTYPPKLVAQLVDSLGLVSDKPLNLIQVRDTLERLDSLVGGGLVSGKAGAAFASAIADVVNSKPDPKTIGNFLGHMYDALALEAQAVGLDKASAAIAERFVASVRELSPPQQTQVREMMKVIQSGKTGVPAALQPLMKAIDAGLNEKPPASANGNATAAAVDANANAAAAPDPNANAQPMGGPGSGGARMRSDTTADRGPKPAAH